MNVNASQALGERSVRVSGDVLGSVIVTGDNNNLRLVLGPEHGAILEQLARTYRPTKRLRPGAVRSVRADFANSVDRGGEVSAILDGAAPDEPINLYGEPGVGKTYVALRAVNADHPALADGVAYLHADGVLEDVLQRVFETWYECDPPFKPSVSQLRDDLDAVQGLLVLDSVTLDRNAVQQLILSLPKCRIVVCSREQVLWHGTSVALHGLERNYAMALIEQELGGPLRPSDSEFAGSICRALSGHPFNIRKAISAGQIAGRSLREIADVLSGDDPELALVQQDLEAAGDEGRKLLAALAVFGSAALGADHLRAIAEIDNFDAVLSAALRRHDISADHQRYSLNVAREAMPDAMAVTSAGDRALAHFIGWAEKLRTQPMALEQEAGALVELLRWAVAAGRQAEAIRLARTIDHIFPLARRFGAWSEVLTLVLSAAVDSGDRGSEAWARHQLGTLAICLGEVAAGAALLGEALRLRRELGHKQAAQASGHNQALGGHSRRIVRLVHGHSVAQGIVGTGFVAAVAVTAGLLISANRGPQLSRAGQTIPPVTATSTSARSTTTPAPQTSTTTTTPRTTPTSTPTTTTTPTTTGCDPGLVIPGAPGPNNPNAGECSTTPTTSTTSTTSTTPTTPTTSTTQTTQTTQTTPSGSSQGY